MESEPLDVQTPTGWIVLDMPGAAAQGSEDAGADEPPSTATLVAPSGSSSGSGASAGGSSQFSPSASEASSESDDLVYHFKRARLPEHRLWARRLREKGYSEMEDLQRASWEDIQRETEMPSGIRMKLEEYTQNFGPDQAALPTGDLEETAPVQAGCGGWGLSSWTAFYTFRTIAVYGGVLCVFAGVPAISYLKGVATAAALTAQALFAAAFDCLDGEAEITMADRSQRRISLLSPGCEVLAYNRGKFKVKTVREVRSGSTQRARSIALQLPCGERAEIRATEGHPFYVQDRGWAVVDPDVGRFLKKESQDRPPARLQPGDRLLLRDAKTATVLEVGPPMAIATHNILLDGPGAFFVNDVLTHSGLPQP